MISSILSFGFDFDIVGWICAIKAGADMVVSIFHAIK